VHPASELSAPGSVVLARPWAFNPIPPGPGAGVVEHDIVERRWHGRDEIT
jgi:hypothetical protein